MYAGRGTETEYRVTGQPGLVLLVRRPCQGGSQTRGWRFHYSLQIDGRQVKRRVKLGDYPAVTLAEARRHAAELHVRVERGEDVIPADRERREEAVRKHLTFADLVEAYLAERAGLARVGEMERELRKDALPRLGDKRPSEITDADLDEIAHEVAARSPVMAYRLVGRLKALFNYAIFDRPELKRRFSLSINPAEHLGRRRRGSSSALPAPKPRQRALYDEEIAAWWQALDRSDMRAGTRAALRLVLVTGQRPGEVRQARRADLRLADAEPTWLIPAVVTKNGREHLVPLSPLAVRLFHDALAVSRSETRVFPSPADVEAPISNVVLPNGQAHLFRTWLPDAKPAHAHDLRRSAATGMRRIGTAPHVVALVLNHTPQDVTGRHYDHYDGLAEKRGALFAWAEHVEKLPAARRSNEA